MLNRLCALPTLLLALLLSTNILADDCFCLIDKDDGIRFDCRIRQSRNAQARYFCAGRKKDGEQSLVPDGDSLTRVPSGEPPCTPCRFIEAGKRNTMRQRDD
uniref:Secreted protein n=1 Tax=Candidatus Kentrum sp. LPFa TaxID=2126335 RepID=A0A450WR87_9GAMM|nr:MAG: hypothetical protein BECKLPF1236B_GA0070989_11761 [Candidatus Kentron sp. LPFa]